MKNEFGLNLTKALENFGVEIIEEDQTDLNFEQSLEKLYEKGGKPNKSSTSSRSARVAPAPAAASAPAPAPAPAAASTPAPAPAPAPAAASTNTAAGDTQLLQKFQAAIAEVVKKSVIEALQQAAQGAKPQTPPTT